MSFADVFFIIVGIILLIGVLLGLMEIISEKFFSYYGGLGATILVYLVNTLEFSFLSWLLELLLVRSLGMTFLAIDWRLGLILGPVYATWCWVKGERNLGMAIFKRD